MVAQVLLIKMCATYYPYYDLFKRFLSTYNNLINFLWMFTVFNTEDSKKDQLKNVVFLSICTS